MRFTETVLETYIYGVEDPAPAFETSSPDISWLCLVVRFEIWSASKISGL